MREVVGGYAKVQEMMTEIESLVPLEKAEFAILCLANYVEVVNGMLYMAGGGWTEHQRPIANANGSKPTSRISMAILVKVPWSETNRKQKFLVEVADDEGAQLMKVEGEVNAGRPANLLPGSAQYVALAVNGDVVFPQAGGYMLRGTLNGEAGSMKIWEFRVHDLPALSQSVV